MIHFNLENPIPYFNTVATNGAWDIVYPKNILNYKLYDSDGLILNQGMWSVPLDIINQWTDNDDIITNALLLEQPWNIKKNDLPIL